MCDNSYPSTISTRKFATSVMQGGMVTVGDIAGQTDRCILRRFACVRASWGGVRMQCVHAWVIQYFGSLHVALLRATRLPGWVPGREQAA